MLPEKVAHHDDVYFENRYLFRILVTLTISIIVHGQNTSKNSFKKTIRYMIYCTLLGEIFSFVLNCYEGYVDISMPGKHMAESSKFVHFLLVDLVFVTFNCSVCYAMAMYLKVKKSTLLRIWHVSIILTMIYIIFYTFLKTNFGRLNHVIHGLISGYSLKLLFQIQNKHQKLFDANVPIFVSRLIKLETMILVFNLIVYPISLFKEQINEEYRNKILFEYDLLIYIMDQCRITIWTSYLLKMYTFIIEWGGSGSMSNKIHDESPKNKEEVENLIVTKV